MKNKAVLTYVAIGFTGLSFSYGYIFPGLWVILGIIAIGIYEILEKLTEFIDSKQSATDEAL